MSNGGGIYTQENRLLAINTPLGEDVLLLARFQGSERLSHLFRFELELLSEYHNVSFEKIIGENVTVSIFLADGSLRHFNGLIARFSHEHAMEDEVSSLHFSRYHATMVPWFWLLTRTADSRIFQKLSVPDIVKKIFDEHGFADYSLRLSGTYEARDYIVQYRETDFNFISRLLEEEGIYYFFEHEEKKHTLVLADSPVEHKPCPKQGTAKCRLSGGGPMEEDMVASLKVAKEIRAGKYSINDFNYEIPNADLKVSVDAKHVLGPGEREIYDYPGLYVKRQAGDHLATIRMEEEEAQITTLSGAGNCRAFSSGCRFRLQDYFRTDMNDKDYVLTAVTHDAKQEGTYVGCGQAAGEAQIAYTNEFQCIPHEVPFRPVRSTRRPVVEGVQTAIVVGPSGEEIYTDKLGRVKVQFHWDREGQRNEDSSCWLRVSQTMAGNSWGGMFLPRVGHEVIVEFIEGDPDRPIITGQVYHGTNLPPYKLPDEKTKSTFKSNTSPDGGGFNEIRFEDKKGEEQVFIHAEKDMDQRVKNDLRQWVGNDRHLIVKRDHFETVEFDKHLNIARDEMTEIGRDRHLKVAGKEAMEIAGSRSIVVNGDMIEVIRKGGSVEAGGDYYIKGMNVVIEGMTGLTIKVGGSFVTLNAGGVFISGPMVNINSGGAALSGAAGKVVAPIAALLAAVAADAVPGKGDKGDKGEQRHKDDDEKNKDKKSWIEIELVDEDGKPAPGEAYKVTLPDGETVATGTLDEKGFARIDGIDPGNCKITFPNLDKDSWAKA
ncbi:MAG: type VI secretion system tip protein VgrG [Desulfobulbaceae bacterium]|nr:type VI secretion system tip protein VgrG [Desulfobulbaceae bacterium]